jgi:hypothetical protein
MGHFWATSEKCRGRPFASGRKAPVLDIQRLTVNQRAVFANKQREILPIVLMQSMITYGLCNFPQCVFF